MGKGSKISLFVFKEGDMVNLLRVIENEDGSYSPYTDKGEEPVEPTFEKIVEDNGMLAKMMKLREKMQNLSVRRQQRTTKSTDSETESSTSDVFLKEDDANVIFDSKCVGQKPISYKLLNECNKNLQIHENNYETGESALKEKHRTKSSLTAFPQETLKQHTKPKSLYSENKGSYSITKQKYARDNIQQKLKKEKGTSVSVQSDVKNSDTNFIEPSLEGADSGYGNLQFARLVLPDSADRPKSTPDGLELEEDAQEIWEIHDSTERLKESATCKIGVLKRRQSVDYAFDAKLGVENSQREVADLNCYKNSDFEVFGRNFYQLPQFISNPSAIPPQYAPKEERMCDYILGNRTIRRSPLYGRKPQNSDDNFNSVPKMQQSTFPSGASNIERLRNDYVENQSEFEKDITNDSFDSVCNLYNIACRSDNAGYSQLCLYSNKSADVDNKVPLNPLRLKTSEESQELANEIKRIASEDSERKVQLDTVKLENLPAVRKKQLRCDQCNRKLNISNNYTCRCGRLFCAQHRYSEVHNCSHDYKTEGRLILERQNPLVVAEKLRKI